VTSAPVGRDAVNPTANVHRERLPRFDMPVLEREREAPDLLDVREVLSQVRQRSTGRHHLHLVALAEQVLGDNSGARRVTEALPNGPVEDPHPA
jgi:hypothetical protein